MSAWRWSIRVHSRLGLPRSRSSITCCYETEISYRAETNSHSSHPVERLKHKVVRSHSTKSLRPHLQASKGYSGLKNSDVFQSAWIGSGCSESGFLALVFMGRPSVATSSPVSACEKDLRPYSRGKRRAGLSRGNQGDSSATNKLRVPCGEAEVAAVNAKRA